MPEPEAIEKVHAAPKEEVNLNNDIKNELTSLKTLQEAS
jgi:hypothetical protein